MLPKIIRLAPSDSPIDKLSGYFRYQIKRQIKIVTSTCFNLLEDDVFEAQTFVMEVKTLDRVSKQCLCDHTEKIKRYIFKDQA